MQAISKSGFLEQFGIGPAATSSPRSGAAGMLSCKYCLRDECFRSRRRPAACNLQADRADAPAFRPCWIARMRLTAHLCTHS